MNRLLLAAIAAGILMIVAGLSFDQNGREPSQPLDRLAFNAKIQPNHGSN